MGPTPTSQGRLRRKRLKTRGAFPNEPLECQDPLPGDQRAVKKVAMPVQDWKAAPNRFVILFSDRVPV